MCFGNSATKPYVAARACQLADGLLKMCILFALNPCEHDVLREGYFIPSQIPHQQSFSTAGAKSSKTLANTPHRPLRCFAAADAQFWCSSLSKSLNKKHSKRYQSERWMPVISTSLTVCASLEKRARPTIWDSSGYFSQISTLLKKLFWNHEFCQLNERQPVNTEIFWCSTPHNSFSTLFWKKNVVKVQKLILPSIWSPHHGIAQDVIVTP